MRVTGGKVSLSCELWGQCQSYLAAEQQGTGGQAEAYLRKQLGLHRSACHKTPDTITCGENEREATGKKM